MEARFLTDEEIEFVLNSTPEFPAPTKEIAQFFRKQIIDSNRKKLKEIKLKPAGLPEFVNLYIEKFQDSLVQPGCPVGLLAASSMGSNITQMQFNTFHFAGSQQLLASRVETLRQITNNTKKKKIERTSIHFENYNLTRSEVFMIVNKIIGVKITSLLDPFKGTSKGYSIVKKPNDWWYSLFESTIRRSEIVINAKDCLRLHFSPYQLYKYNITFEGIEEILTEKLPQIVCVWSPLSEGIFDIYINESLLRTLIEKNIKKGRVVNFSSDDIILQFRQFEILPALAQNIANLTGIEGLEIVNIQEKSVLSHVLNTKRLATNDTSNDWRIWINATETLVQGIPEEKYDVFFGTLRKYGVEVLAKVSEDSDFHYDIRVPVSLGGNPPDKIFKKLIEEVDNDLDVKRREQQEREDYDLSKIDELYRASKYIYADANTREFIKILSYPEVNSQRTICWNESVIQATLGIDAACNIIARSLYDVIESAIAPQHLYLIARSMCFTGSIVSISSRGATKQNRGALADASFELPIDAFVNSATFGRKEKLDAISARIFVGNRCKLGTGSVELEIDEEKLNGLIAEKEKREAYQVDLSFFETDDNQFVDRNEIVVNEVGDTIHGTNEELDTLFDNIQDDIQGETGTFNLEEDSSWIWNTIKETESSQVKTKRDVEDLGEFIQEYLGNI